MCDKDDIIEKTDDNEDSRKLCLEDIKKHIVCYAISDYGLYFTESQEVIILEYENKYFELYTNDNYEYIDILGLNTNEQKQIKSFYQAIQENKKFFIELKLDKPDQYDMTKFKIEYFDNVVERIIKHNITSGIENFYDYEEFNVVIGNNLYKFSYEKSGLKPLVLRITSNNKYNINLDKSGIYYKGIKVGDL